MQNVFSIYDAKAHLSRLLRYVKQGQEVIISERGTPIVRMIPFESQGNFSEQMAHWCQRGIVLKRKRARVPKGQKRDGALKRFLQDRE